MKKKIRVRYTLFVVFLVLFAALTFAVQKVDVQTYQPKEYLSEETTVYEGAAPQIGLASINLKVQEKLGENELCYKITKLIGYFALATVPCFGLLGLAQLVRKKRVDGDLWALLVHYVLVAGCYVAFEKYIVNYRPVLEEGVLEASYPSSHTMLAVALLGAAVVQMKKRIRVKPLRWFVDFVLIVLILAMVAGRMVSGIHWMTDILGGVLIGLALVNLYAAVFTQIRRAQKKKAKKHRR